jgi:hypothetical protein
VLYKVDSLVLLLFNELGLTIADVLLSLGMKDHHIRHHLISENNWLGFSVPQIDDLFGTNPDVKEFRKQESER